MVAGVSTLGTSTLGADVESNMRVFPEAKSLTFCGLACKASIITEAALSSDLLSVFVSINFPFGSTT